MLFISPLTFLTGFWRSCRVLFSQSLSAVSSVCLCVCVSNSYAFYFCRCVLRFWRRRNVTTPGTARLHTARRRGRCGCTWRIITVSGSNLSAVQLPRDLRDVKTNITAPFEERSAHLFTFIIYLCIVTQSLVGLTVEIKWSLTPVIFWLD